MGDRMMKKTLKKGDKIMAKWSGSKVFYPATIIEVKGQQHKVQFEDGSISSVRQSDIKIEDTTDKGYRRTRSRSRSRSTGRSPIQKRSSSRSPSRKAATTKPEKKTSQPKPSAVQTRSKSNHADAPKPEKVKVDEDSVKLVNFPLLTSSSSTSSSFSNSTTEKVSYLEVFDRESQKEHANTLNLRTSARIAALQTAKAVISTPPSVDELKERVPLSRELRRRRSSSSDEEEEEESEEDEVDTVRAKSQKTFSFLSFALVLLKILYLPAMIVFFYYACGMKQCTIYDLPPMYTRWKEFENDVKLPLIACVVFHVFLCVISKIPIGYQIAEHAYVPKGRAVRKYRMNGIYILLVTIAAFSGMVYFGIFVAWNFRKIRTVVISSLIYTTIWSIILYIYGVFKKQDPDETKPCHKAGFLGDFYFGREMNPWLFNFEDVKTRFIHFGLIGMVLVELNILSKFFFMKGLFPVPLILIFAMHILFVFTYFWREDFMISSATYTDDGVGFGFLTGIGSVIPSFFVLQLMFLVTRNAMEKLTHLPHWCSAAIAILFLCGFVIYYSSMSLKCAFRKDPYSSSLSYVASIPTSKKKRLIVSGLWGVVRHPNYLGLIIMLIASSLPCGFTHVLPYMPLLFFVLLLVLRSLRVESICREKYGPAWQNYTETVSSRFIPYVF